MDIKLEIIKTLIEIGEPVTFSAVGKRTDATAQLVNHHLKTLVKDGIVLTEVALDGKRYYVLQPMFYDPAVRALMEGAVSSSVRLSANEQYCSPAQAWKCLSLMLEMLKP